MMAISQTVAGPKGPSSVEYAGSAPTVVVCVRVSSSEAEANGLRVEAQRATAMVDVDH
jgi:hypothetical protein